MEAHFLHRSTRKLSLTEAGQAFFTVAKKCLQLLRAWQETPMNLRDDLVKDLRIATTPELGATHLAPALKPIGFSTSWTNGSF